MFRKTIITLAALAAIGCGIAWSQTTVQVDAIGRPGDTACATDNGSCSLIALQKRGNQNSTTLNATAGGAVPAGTNYIGQVGINAATTGGWTANHLVAANSNNSTNLKASAGIVHAVQGYGIGSAPAYIKLYDKATAPTCGTDTPIKVIMIPAAPTAANGSGALPIPLDIQFSNGIGFCVVTGIANNDNTSVAAATFLVEIDWK